MFFCCNSVSYDVWTVYLFSCFKASLNVFFESYSLINSKNYVPDTLENILLKILCSCLSTVGYCPKNTSRSAVHLIDLLNPLICYT